MRKIALLFVGGLIVSSAFQQGYAEASRREAPASRTGQLTAPGALSTPAHTAAR